MIFPRKAATLDTRYAKGKAPGNRCFSRKIAIFGYVPNSENREKSGNFKDPSKSDEKESTFFCPEKRA